MTGYITQDADLLVWTSDAWLHDARGWIASRLLDLGRPATAPSEQIQVRAWGTVLRTPTVGGDVYFKASAENFEAPLTQRLSELRPAFVLPTLSSDVERGWVLLPAAGTRLRDLDRERQEPHWERVLPAYAALQLELADRCDELLDLGVPDQRLGVVPEQYERLVENDALLSDLTSAQRRRLRALAPLVGEMCSELGRFGIPSTLQHDELHDGHVYLRDGGYVLLDWAECVISHPFITLRGMFLYFADVFGISIDDPLFGRWRDVYLDAWVRFGSAADLREAFRLVYAVGAVCRALRWQGILGRMQPPFRERYGETVPTILRGFLDAVD